MKKRKTATPIYDSEIEAILEKGGSASKSHLLLEMAQMTRPADNVPNGGAVYIYASGDQCKREHNPPHFHIFLDSERILSLAVDIATLEPIGLYSFNKRSSTSRLVERVASWAEYADYERFVMRWLPLFPAGSLHSNHRRVIDAWNDSNVELDQADTAIALGMPVAAIPKAKPARPKIHHGGK